MDTVTMGVTPAPKSGTGLEGMCQKGTQQKPLCQEAFSALLCLAVRKSGESKAKTSGRTSSLGTGSHHSPVPAVSGVRAGHDPAVAQTCPLPGLAVLPLGLPG